MYVITYTYCVDISKAGKDNMAKIVQIRAREIFDSRHLPIHFGWKVKILIG